MTNRTRAEKLFKAESDLKAARKKVLRLVARVATLAENLEGEKPPAISMANALRMEQSHNRAG